MPTRNLQLFCVHSHFYQPPRGNPVTGDIGVEATAEKYRNWNERATAESYRPNADIGNFDQISFDVGETLMFWLRRRAPETYRRIVQADKLHTQQKKVGNAMAGPLYDVILPLLKRRDKYTQLYWGKLAFRHHFGHDSQGVWLPEAAIDMETLMMAEALGYQYIILAHGQIASSVDSGGPFNIDLPNGRKIAAFVRNDELSNDLSFNIERVGGAGHWARNKLGGRRASNALLTLVATDGETFGHHHLGEERFLHWLLAHEAPAIGFRVVTLGEVLRDFPPTESVEVKPYSSWSCFHGVSRWSTGCPCTPGYSGWKSALLRAIDNLQDVVDDIYTGLVRPLNIDPWKLRNEYIRVRTDEMEGPALLAEFVPGLKSDVEERILNVLHAELLLAKSYTSEGWYFEDFDRKEPRYAVATAAYAIKVVEDATGERIGDQFRSDLGLVSSGISTLHGSEMYDSVVEEYLTPKPEPQPSAEPVTVATASPQPEPTSKRGNNNKSANK